MPRKVCRAGRQINVVLDRELHAAIEAHARDQGMTTSAIVRMALRAYFGVSRGEASAEREGHLTAFRVALATIRRALAEINPDTPPGDAAQTRPRAPLDGR